MNRLSQGKKRLSGRQNVGKLRILVAPLDWGLGHATRCIPVIQELLNNDFEVWLAGEGAQKALLQQEFPSLPFLSLRGYNIRYARSGKGLLWSMILQNPKIQNAIHYEHSWLKKKVAEHGFDAVISDNRFGLYHKKIPCIFITHQLTIKTFLGKWTERILQKRNYHYINKFSECWIPDNADEKNNLSGALSHTKIKPITPIQYIGWLSRIEQKNIKEEKNHLLILLSGPEPQRSILEDIITSQIAHYNGSATVLRGLPISASMIPSTNTIRFYNHLNAEELGKEMEKASFIIARSGYSTVMDIIKLKKKSILIPTPGQTEQEYLGKYLSEKQIAASYNQKEFSLTKALEQAQDFLYQFPDPDTENNLHKAISNLRMLVS